MGRHEYAMGTWTETVGPWGLFTRARAICPDGKVRVVRLAQTADTFFSVPARVSYRGKTVAGFITFHDKDGLTTTPGQFVHFIPVNGRKNSSAFRDAFCKQVGTDPSIPDPVLSDLCKEKGIDVSFLGLKTR